MRTPFFFGAGGVLSADIAVPDHKRELAFYASILTTGDSPLWREDLMNNFGTPIIGLGERIPENEALPLQWMPHFQVNDIAASVERAISLGGKEIMHGKTDSGESQWAVVTDQFGAGVGLIPVVPEDTEKYRINERQGRIAWISLTVPDAAASRDFYQQVLGWKAKDAQANDSGKQVAGFEMQADNGIVAAEIIQAHSEQNEIPPVWLIHLPVGDLDDSLEKVNAGGGAVIKEFAEGKVAVIRDPVGVYLALQSSQ